MIRLIHGLVPLLSVGCQTAVPCLTAPPAPPQLATTTRAPVVPDTSALASDTAPPPARPPHYRRLTADECRRLAICAAPLADALDSHPENQPCGHHLIQHRTKAARAELSRLVRGYAADEIRNRSAAEALELFYQLLAAEGQFDRLAEAHTELRKQLAAVEKAEQVGVADRADADRLRRRRLELDSQLARLEAAIAVLNAGLAGRLALDPCDPLPLWPTDPLQIDNDIPDTEQAVATALAFRPDLNLLRVLAQYDSSGELAKAVLDTAHPLLGKLDPTGPLAARLAALRRDPTRAEQLARQQVTQLLAARERQAAAETRAAVASLRGAVAAVAAKTAEVRNLERRVAEIAQRAAAGVAGAEAELLAARLDLLKLQAELVQAAVDVKLAQVKLRQTLGTLVRE